MTNKTVLDVLIKARKMIKNPQNWCQGAFHNVTARRNSYCAMGAVSFAAIALKCKPYGAFPVLAAALPDGGNARDLVHYNDTHAHAEVLALFDAAIANETTQ